MESYSLLCAFLRLSVQMGTPLLLGTLGGILSEKAGHINLGVEGMMLLGAAFGYQCALSSASPALALLAAAAAGAFGALIYAAVTVTLRANQTVTGLALTIFGTGIAGTLGKTLGGRKLPESVRSFFAPLRIPLLSDLPVLGETVFSQSVYILFSLAFAVLLYFYLAKSRAGLFLRAVGENPAAADASGINVSFYKYTHIVAGGALCGLGGAYLSLVFVPIWQNNITAGIGWIAAALVIFSAWNPLKAIGGAYFFGALQGLGLKLQNTPIRLFGYKIQIATQILDMLPYFMTIVALVFIVRGKKRENQPPAALGAPYFREDR